MRISPLVTLGLTNIGTLSLYLYGTSTSNAVAVEPVQPVEESGQTDIVEASVGEPPKLDAIVSAEPMGLALLAPKPAFTESTLQPQSVRSFNLTDIGSSQIAPNTPVRFSAIELDRSQIKRVVAQSLEKDSLVPLATEPANIEQASPEQTRPEQNIFLAAQPLAQPPKLSESLPTPVESEAQLVAQFNNSQISSPQALPETVNSPSPGRLPVLAPPASTPPSQSNDLSAPDLPRPNRPTPSFSRPAPATPNVSAPNIRSFPGLSASVDGNYGLGPGDIISVSFFNVPEYDGQHRISTSGTIDLPLVGRFSIGGLTVAQANEAIAARYVRQLQSPIVSVNVLQARPVQVAISGEIVQPGLYTLAGQESEYPRLFQALQQAGGLTQAANLTQVEVRRKGLDGQAIAFSVDLLSLLQDGDIDQNVFLQDGDVIIIPSSTQLDRVALSQLADSNLRANRAEPVDIAIVGQVTQPGPYRIEAGDGSVTLVQALQEAGGITSSADLRKVQLRRQTRQGTEQVFDINLWELLQEGDLSQDLALQQGDTVLVPTALEPTVAELTALASSSISPGTIEVNVVGEVESPGTLAVQANTSFNEALLASGGLNRRAQKDATLVRFNPNGTVTRQEIDIDLSQDINAETNPILQPSDVIVVGRSGRAAFNDGLREVNNTLNLALPFLLLF